MAMKNRVSENVASEAQQTGRSDNPTVQTGGASSVMHEPLDDAYLTDVKGDEKYSYFWASTNRAHPQSVERMQRYGFEVVPENSSEETVFAEKRDGGRVVGDLVLMRIPKETAERLRKQRYEAFHRRLSATEEKMLSVGKNTDGVTNTVTESGEGNRSFFFFSNNPLAK